MRYKSRHKSVPTRSNCPELIEASRLLVLNATPEGKCHSKEGLAFEVVEDTKAIWNDKKVK